ncbi:MAG: hypothetical protein U5L11_01470 [Arhodomonas sp.]|nr:hypothetical protein [Arhodomonas sp.]
MFATFPERAGADEVVARLPRQWRGFVARARNTSPLLGRLREAQDCHR